MAEDDLRAAGPQTGPAVLGYAYAQLLTRPQNAFQRASTSVYVHQLAVDRTARKRGIGSALLEAVSARARGLGAEAVRLDSWAFNADAHAVFRAQGFQTSRVVFERDV